MRTLRLCIWTVVHLVHFYAAFYATLRLDGVTTDGSQEMENQLLETDFRPEMTLHGFSIHCYNIT